MDSGLIRYDLVMDNDLQRREDHYVNLGLTGDRLRHALENDKEYQVILKNRLEKLKQQAQVATEEVKRYVLSTDKDYIIIDKIHKLENQRLSDADKEIVELIRTQLELDWRSPIILRLDGLLDKYKKA